MTTEDFIFEILRRQLDRPIRYEVRCFNCEKTVGSSIQFQKVEKGFVAHPAFICEECNKLPHEKLKPEIKNIKENWTMKQNDSTFMIYGILNTDKEINVSGTMDLSKMEEIR